MAVKQNLAEGLTADWIQSTLRMIPAGETTVGLAEIWLHEHDIVLEQRSREFREVACRVSELIGAMIKANVVRENASDWQVRAGIAPTRKTQLGKCRVLMLC